MAEVAENQEFTNVGQYIEHLEESGEETVATQDVVDTLKDILSRPVSAGQRRGKLAGLELEDMDDEQLKRELINAKSVLYKAQKRGASPDTIAKNQARVDAALEEKAKRTPAEEEASEDSEDVYEGEADTNEDVEAEI